MEEREVRDGGLRNEGWRSEGGGGEGKLVKISRTKHLKKYNTMKGVNSNISFYSCELYKH